VRQLIEEAVIAEGIQILVKQVSLFTPEFEEKLKALKSDEARASEMEHAVKSGLPRPRVPAHCRCDRSVSSTF